MEATGWQKKIFEDSALIGNEFAAGSVRALLQILKETLEGAGEMPVIKVLRLEAFKQIYQGWKQNYALAEQASMSGDYELASRLLTKTGLEINGSAFAGVGTFGAGRTIVGAGRAVVRDRRAIMIKMGIVKPPPVPKYSTKPMLERWLGGIVEGLVFPDSAVTYLDEVALQDYRLIVKGGLIYDSKGGLFDTMVGNDMLLSNNSAIYVMDEFGGIFATKNARNGYFHHSRFLKGEPIAAVGEIVISNGRVKHITNGSGHYRPGPRFMDQFFEELTLRGVDISSVK